jgi:agmatine deiminase
MSTTFTTRKTPAKLAYRMPAEWEPHAATWLTWPRPDGISFPDRYESSPAVYAWLIGHLAAVEEVHINVWDAEMEARVRETLTALKTPLARVFFHHFPAYEPWCRDHGPVFVTREHQGHHERAVVDWGYNAWGGKYPPYDLDDVVPQHIAAFRDVPLFQPGIVLEGGSIEVNGRGTLLTTESCLLNPNRNPELSQAEVNQYLREYLGVEKILWLGEGIVGDDTDGHIDAIAQYVRPGVILLQTILGDDTVERWAEICLS